MTVKVKKQQLYLAELKYQNEFDILPHRALTWFYSKHNYNFDENEILQKLKNQLIDTRLNQTLTNIKIQAVKNLNDILSIIKPLSEKDYMYQRRLNQPKTKVKTK